MLRSSVGEVQIRSLLAPNPGPFTLDGTNSYVVSDEDGVWVVDPGPAIGTHLDGLAAAVVETEAPWRGILLTHDHGDHSEGVPGLLERAGWAPVYAARGAVDARLSGGETVGPFVVVATPGHAPDHLAFVVGEELLSGDSVLGRGSVFVWPTPGALSGYLDALARLRALPLSRIHPGHGPLVDDAHAKLDEYRAHRLAREDALLAALTAGHRTIEALLDAAWADVPGVLRPAAAVTLAAHLDKLGEEGRLPEGVERPAIPELNSPEV